MILPSKVSFISFNLSGFKLKENKIIFFNDGEPIEKEILSSMFEPYKKGKKGENGIGLSIVKGNCDLIGYKVIAKNKKNGVEFIINKGTK